MAGYTASVIVIVVFTLRSEIGLDSMVSGHVNTSHAIVLKSVPETLRRVLLQRLTLPDIPNLS